MWPITPSTLTKEQSNQPGRGRLCIDFSTLFAFGVNLH